MEDADNTPSELPSVKQEPSEANSAEQESSVKSESKEAATDNAAGAAQETDQPVLDEEEIKTIDPLSRCTLLAFYLPSRRPQDFAPSPARLLHQRRPQLRFHRPSRPLSPLFHSQWGMSSSGVIRGMTSDFRYVLKLSEPSEPDKPVNGSYNGYFWMRSVPISRVTENNLILSFTKHRDHYIVDGTGQNRMGPFSIAGLYFPATHVMNCEKLSRFLES